MQWGLAALWALVALLEVATPRLAPELPCRLELPAVRVENRVFCVTPAHAFTILPTISPTIWFSLLRRFFPFAAIFPRLGTFFSA